LAKNIIILGAGESGVGAALLAKQKGYNVFVSDASAIKSIYQSELEANGIAFESGMHDVERILEADEVIKSQWQDNYNIIIIPYLQSSRARRSDSG